MDPKKLLFVLLGVVPLCVAGSGIAAYLLQRAGYGLLVWGLVPLGGLLLVALILGGGLGWAASRPRNGGRSSERSSEDQRDEGR